MLYQSTNVFFLVLKSYLATGSLTRRFFFLQEKLETLGKVVSKQQQVIKDHEAKWGELDDGLQKWMTGWTLDLHELHIHEDTRIPTKQQGTCSLLHILVTYTPTRVADLHQVCTGGVFCQGRLRAFGARTVGAMLARKTAGRGQTYSCIAMLVKLVGVVMRGIFLTNQNQTFSISA